MSIPKAFVSYSWDNLTHKNWVRDFSQRLRQDGVDVTLDQWDAAPGDQLPAFMNRAVRENDFVLIICTTNYKTKSDFSGGGVGYEGDVIQAEVFVLGNHRKFIPLLRYGEWATAAPSALAGKYYIDLRDGPDYEDNYQELLLTLHGRRDKAPAVGAVDLDVTFEHDSSRQQESETNTRDLPKPRHYTFISDQKVEALFPQIPSSYVRSFRDGSREENPYFKVGVVAQYLQEYAEVGTIDNPKAYFKGSISARCLVTDAEVFFGKDFEDSLGSEKYKYVALSGSLKHMRDEPFRSLAQNAGNGAGSSTELWYAKAQYVPMNSNTAGFHEYLQKIAMAETKKDHKRDSWYKGWYKERSNLLAAFVWLLICGLPLVSAVLSWRWIHFWAFIGMTVTFLWALCGIWFLYSFITVWDHIAIDFGSGATLECSIRTVMRRLRAPKETYEFLARTIAVGDCEGESVLLGSPVYIALGDYKAS